MDIVDFFRSIDGIPYYLMLVVNAILIFAIIGYLGEKNNEKYVKLGMKTNLLNSNGTVNLNPITTPKHSSTSIPTVAPTMANNQGVDNVVTANNNVQSIVANVTDPNVGINMANQNSTFVNNGAINNNNNNINSTQAIVRPEDNDIDPNEKAPAVLVINSNNTNMPK